MLEIIIDSHFATKPDGRLLIKKEWQCRTHYVKGTGFPIFTDQNSIILAYIRYVGKIIAIKHHITQIIFILPQPFRQKFKYIYSINIEYVIRSL